eukprot:3094435-Rhodomonas_salina.1
MPAKPYTTSIINDSTEHLKLHAPCQHRVSHRTHAGTLHHKHYRGSAARQGQRTAYARKRWSGELAQR